MSSRKLNQGIREGFPHGFRTPMRSGWASPGEPVLPQWVESGALASEVRTADHSSNRRGSKRPGITAKFCFHEQDSTENPVVPEPRAAARAEMDFRFIPRIPLGVQPPGVFLGKRHSAALQVIAASEDSLPDQGAPGDAFCGVLAQAENTADLLEDWD